MKNMPKTLDKYIDHQNVQHFENIFGIYKKYGESLPSIMEYNG